MKFPFSAIELNAMTVDERIALTTGEFGRWKMAQAARHIAPFWWIEPKQSPVLITPPGVRVHNGTAFFVKIGAKNLCVTAAHVYRGYIAAKQNYPGLWCRLGEGDFIFDAEANLHSIGGETERVDKVDIATFQITEEVLTAINKEPIVVAERDWPPPHPMENQESTAIGYPGSLRLWLNANAISFGIYCAGPKVGTASDRQITLPFEREFWVDTMGRGLPPAGMNLGGISGGPLLILTEKDRDWSFNVAGVISEMSPSAYIETVIVEPAHFISADGAVRDERSAPIKHYIPAEKPSL